MSATSERSAVRATDPSACCRQTAEDQPGRQARVSLSICSRAIARTSPRMAGDASGPPLPPGVRVAEREVDRDVLQQADEFDARLERPALEDGSESSVRGMSVVLRMLGVLDLGRDPEDLAHVLLVGPPNAAVEVDGSVESRDHERGQGALRG